MRSSNYRLFTADSLRENFYSAWRTGTLPSFLFFRCKRVFGCLLMGCDLAHNKRCYGARAPSCMFCSHLSLSLLSFRMRDLQLTVTAQSLTLSCVLREACTFVHSPFQAVFCELFTLLLVTCLRCHMQFPLTLMLAAKTSTRTFVSETAVSIIVRSR